jgi:hypothetical protein
MDFKVKGNLQLNVYKHDEDGTKVKIDSFDEENLIVLDGKQIMAYLLAGEPGNHTITKFGVGEGTALPVDDDAGLTNPYIRSLTGYRFLTDTAVQWDVALDVGEAIGKTISEFGLFSADEQLFARKIRRGLAIPKDASISFDGAWTVFLLECQKTTFSSQATIKVIISDLSGEFANYIASNAGITISTSSKIQSQRELKSTIGMQTVIISGGAASALFNTAPSMTFGITDPRIDFTNVERRFTASANAFTSISDSVKLAIWGNFESAPEVEFNIANSDIYPAAGSFQNNQPNITTNIPNASIQKSVAFNDEFVAGVAAGSAVAPNPARWTVLKKGIKLSEGTSTPGWLDTTVNATDAPLNDLNTLRHTAQIPAGGFALTWRQQSAGGPHDIGVRIKDTITGEMWRGNFNNYSGSKTRFEKYNGSSWDIIHNVNRSSGTFTFKLTRSGTTLSCDVQSLAHGSDTCATNPMIVELYHETVTTINCNGFWDYIRLT